MKKFTIPICILCLYAQNIFSQTVPANFFGINHWMPGHIPVSSGYPDGGANCPSMQTLVTNAGVKLVRIGGGNSTDGYDKFGTDWNGTSASNNCYMAAIDAVGVTNADFLIQVPFSSGITSSQAQTMVVRLATKYPGKVFYYAIGNEWDKYIDPNTGFKYYASDIATKIKSFATAMKDPINGDPTIKIVAPALSYYGAPDRASAAIMPILISGNGNASDITGKDANGNYYIDVVDFHSYAIGTNGSMNNIGSGSGHNYSDYRGNAIAYPSGGFATNLASLQSLISYANSHTRTSPSSPLTYAITEMNIDWENPPLSNTTYPGIGNNNDVYGLGPRSFFAGQYFADMFSAMLEDGTPFANNKVEFVNPWCINESDGNGSTYDLSMTKGDLDANCSNPTPQALSTYWHYQMVATNFAGNAFFPNVSTASGQTNYKAFACSTATEIRVMLMNQNEQSAPRGSNTTTDVFKINFSNSTPTGGATDMLVAFDMSNSNIAGGGCSGGNYCCSIQRETTMLLVFNKSTGLLTKCWVYGLSQALDDEPPMDVIYMSRSISTSTDYDTDPPHIYADVTIGTNPSSTVVAGVDKVWRYIYTGTVVPSTFSNPLGKQVTFIPTPACY